MHTHHQHHGHSNRLAVLGLVFAVLLALLLLLALPSRTQAAPRHDYGLSITATPDPSTAGQGVYIYGQLTGPNNADKRIWLFHRINPAQRFTLIGSTRTDGQGYYHFVRADGVVNTNRNWYVVGPDRSHSDTVHELVYANVSLAANTASTTTADPVQFTGTIFPAHPHQRVVLQEQETPSTDTTTDVWHTIDVGYTNGDSQFAIPHRFRVPGNYTLRAFFPGDPRNIASESASVNLAVQQAQNTSFTISGTPAEVIDGQSETITGTLYVAGSTTTVQPNVNVTLYGKEGTGTFKAIEPGSTDANGDYTFTVMPLHNTVYQVRTGSGATLQETAKLFVGVQDVVNAQLSSPTVALGDSVMVTGTVTPSHEGHNIYLQEQTSQGGWVDVMTGSVTAASTFSFDYTPGQTGNENLRVQITGGPWNVGGVSSTMQLAVNGVAPISSLPSSS